MIAGTEPVTGYISFHGPEGDKYGSYVCIDCLDSDDTDLSEVSDESVDGPLHCESCGVPLNHPLTDYGVRELRQTIAEGAGCCRELWPTVWSDVLPDEPYFDRFDICEAHYLYARVYGEYQTIARLHSMEFTPGLSLREHDEPERALTDNGQAIYYRLVSTRTVKGDAR